MEFGWVDFSEEDRRTALALVDAAKDHRTLDELGIGIVRDAFSDALFPATSTVMTRLRYFYLVPYLGIQLERASKPYASSQSAADAFSQKEKRLAQTLVKSNRPTGESTESSDDRGIIGSTRVFSNQEWVKRSPADIYWSALRQLGFHQHPNTTQREMFERAANQSAFLEPHLVLEDEEEIEGASDDRAARQSLWNLNGCLFNAWQATEWKTGQIPLLPTQAEAEDFRARYQRTFGDSLMALMLRDQSLGDTAVGADNSFRAFAEDMLKNHAIAITDRQRELIETALIFDDLIFGAFVRYNIIAAPSEEWEKLWEESLPAMLKAAQKLNLKALDELLGLSAHRGWPRLKIFLACVQQATLVHNTTELDILIRERALKRENSRLLNPDGNGNWIGQWHLSYRFGTASRMLEDLRNARASAKEASDVRS